MKLGSIALSTLAALALAGCVIGDRASGTFEPNVPDTLTVMTQPLPTTGFWEGEGDDATGGMEYAMAHELADQFGLDHVVVETEPFSKIAAGDLGNADIAMSLIAPTPEREQVLDFSSPYFNAAPALLARAGTEVPDVQTAQGLQWAVGRNTTFEDLVNEMISPDRAPLEFENRSREIRAVEDGSADVAMFDLPAAEAITSANPDLEVVAKLSQTEPIAIALPKGSDNVEAVSSDVRRMLSDGTIDSLSERWLGTSITQLEAEVPLLRTDEP